MWCKEQMPSSSLWRSGHALEFVLLPVGFKYRSNPTVWSPDLVSWYVLLERCNLVQFRHNISRVLFNYWILKQSVFLRKSKQWFDELIYVLLCIDVQVFICKMSSPQQNKELTVHVSHCEGIVHRQPEDGRKLGYRWAASIPLRWEGKLISPKPSFPGKVEVKFSLSRLNENPQRTSRSASWAR